MLDQLQFQLRRRANDLLRATDVGDARQLDQNLVVRAVPGNDRFGHAQFVHTALDRLQRLRDGFLAKLVRDVGAHREGVSPRARCAVEHRLDVRQELTERRVLLGRHAIDAKLRRAGHGDRPGDVLRLHLLAQTVRRGLGLESDRVVGLHPHHQVDAALQIETQTNFLLRGVKGIHRQRDDADDDKELPTQVLRHVQLP